MTADALSMGCLSRAVGLAVVKRRVPGGSFLVAREDITAPG